MKVITLLENTSNRADLTAEHGLSLYIETETHKILFDAGQSDAFAKNAAALGVDLTQVDFAVLSHGHYDHGGGLLTFLQINDHAPVYLSCHAFGPHYNASERYIGLVPELLKSDRLRFVDGDTQICDGIRLYTAGTMPLPWPVNPFGLKRKEHGCFINEDFRHEIYMTVRAADKTVLFSGCSHRGILNIASRFRPDICFGGFHFSKLSCTGTEGQMLENAGKSLLSFPTVFYTGHCTGSEQYAFLKEIMKDRLHSITCGSQIVIEP